MNKAGVCLEDLIATRQLLIDLDHGGRVLWMNESARARLGAVENFLQALPKSSVPEGILFLTARDTSDRPGFSCVFQRGDQQDAVPVHFVRLLSTASHIMLIAEPKERASDTRISLERASEQLLSIQRSAVGNYYRLSRMLPVIESRLPWDRRRVGELITSELERERTRIARELHAGAGQTLAGIKLNLDLIRTQLPSPPESVDLSLQRIELLADEAIRQLRSISHRLHPPDWQQLNLNQALESLWNITGIPEQFDATIELQPMAAEPSYTIRVAVYQLAQEGLANVLRHAGATKVRFILQERDGSLLVTIEDNGTGFDLREVTAPSTGEQGIGLRAMREHAAALGGELRVLTSPQGTRLEITLPLSEDS